ncbi:MAG: Asd/ArgC dimerization domain-containing protein [Bryobacteraceae bacterium]
MINHDVCIVGGESLLGRELRDQLAETKFPARVKLIGADEEGAKVLSIQDGEPVVITELDADVLERSRVVFLTGSPLSSRKAHGLVLESASKPEIIDLTGALEDQPNARLRAPILEAENYSVPAGAIHVIAHPAATMLAQIFRRIHRHYPILHSVVQIFEPASERGYAGLTELQKQTASLLAFKTLPKEVFDAQLSFNMLPRYGSDAPVQLEDIEHRIDRHLASLSHNAPVPSIRLSQAPVFHGYSCSIWLEFENNPGSVAVSEALASAQIEVRGADLEPPSNVGSVGQSGVTVGLLETDRNHPKAMWMWAVADNFRVAADSAMDVARQLL